MWVSDMITDLLQSLLNEQSINPSYIAMDSIFDYYDDEDTWSEFGQHALNFFGHVYQHMWEQKLTCLSASRAAEAMIELFGPSEVELAYSRDELGHWHMVSTMGFEEKHKVAVNVLLPGSPYQGAWHLTDDPCLDQAGSLDHLLALARAGLPPVGKF
jgi:hypothetical protein